MVAGAVCVAVVAASIGLFDNWVPVLSLGVLFVFAVLPIAVFWGTWQGALVGVLSMLTFNFFYLPPIHTLTLADSRNWFALAVFLATAFVVGALGARARRQTDEARRRERESTFLADVASELLRGTPVAEGLGRVEQRAAEVLDVSSVHITLENTGVGTGEEAIRLPESEEPELGVRR